MGGDNTGKKYKRHVPKELDKRKNNAKPMLLKEADMEKVKDLCSIGCTMREVEQFMGVSHETVERAIKRYYKMGWKSFFKLHATAYKTSLRRLQMRSAEGDYDEKGEKYRVLPSVAMQIWLGKQFLDQKDKNETVVEEKTNIPQFEWADAEDITDQKEIEEKSSDKKEEEDED